jgi:hypothetical protein
MWWHIGFNVMQQTVDIPAVIDLFPCGLLLFVGVLHFASDFPGRLLSGPVRAAHRSNPQSASISHT